MKKASYICAECGRPIMVFADQIETVDRLRPEDRLHHACSVFLHGVFPSVWHCPRCDRPAAVYTGKQEPSFMVGPHDESIAQLQCGYCQCLYTATGRDPEHALKMLYDDIRKGLARHLTMLVDPQWRARSDG